jgi:hypothetical protein
MFFLLFMNIFVFYGPTADPLCNAPFYMACKTRHIGFRRRKNGKNQGKITEGVGKIKNYGRNISTIYGPSGGAKAALNLRHP